MTIPGRGSISFPVAIFRRSRKSLRRSSVPAFGSQTSRSFGCTMPRRHATGESVFLPIAARYPDIYDERFCRMWEFYLARSEMSFRMEG